MAVDLAAYGQTGLPAYADAVVDAIGPETFTYRELVTTIGRAIGCERPVIGVPPAIGLMMSRLVGLFVRDVVVTREEIAGLMDNLLVTASPAAGRTALSAWVLEHRDALGRAYSSELARRRDRLSSYDALAGR